ncbi:Leucine Rich repeats (2 copies) [Carpediemonas membranifera]|uniref:Leucine Rich repeats (2 copies) n=1 Tax=Carpediemonas membranifera TaxID=201153 RepID=A0A8J6AQV4_9EUKA|nr:Leucine Rich repeats (2 copies) [Carpediemonas membranifera]|eukprot:KAG9391528.1 Leucine Rich repeats (2 copies) [Carpediemonas membranifera]
MPAMLSWNAEYSSISLRDTTISTFAPPNSLTQSFDSIPLSVTLRKLDLHSNNLTELPGPDSWAQMTSLRVLFLHSNKISDLAGVAGLIGAPALTILTLYDNPIARHPGYRNFLVNTLPVLRVLDNHNISDEECIDGAQFSRWAACSREMIFQYSADSFPDSTESRLDRPRSALKHALMSDYMPVVRARTPKSRPRSSLGVSRAVEQSTDPFVTYQLMYDVLRDELYRVDAMFRHRSPVVIIQRWVRGWLGRREAAEYKKATSKAATVIQAVVRGHQTRVRVGPDLKLHHLNRMIAARLIQRFIRRSLALKARRRQLIDMFFLHHSARAIQRAWRAQRVKRLMKFRETMLTNPSWFIVPDSGMSDFMSTVTAALASVTHGSEQIRVVRADSPFEWLGERRGAYLARHDRPIGKGPVLQIRRPAPPETLKRHRIVVGADLGKLAQLRLVFMRPHVTGIERTAYTSSFETYSGVDTIKGDIRRSCSIVRCPNDPTFLRHLAAMLEGTAGIQAIRCHDAIREAAAVKIQSTFRAHRTRAAVYSSKVLFPHGFIEERIRLHAASRIQAAFRSHRSLQALRIYTGMEEVCRRVGTDGFFFIRSSDLRVLDRACAAPPEPLPLRSAPAAAESMPWVQSDWRRAVVAQGTRAFTHRTVQEADYRFSFDITPDPSNAPVFLLPPASKYILTKAACIRLTVPAFPVHTTKAAGLTAGQAVSLVRSGSVIQPISNISQFKVPWFGKMNFVARSLYGYTRVSFADTDEAKRRALLLFLHTFVGRTMSSLPIISLSEVKRQEAAALIQAAWRGFVVRSMHPTRPARTPHIQTAGVGTAGVGIRVAVTPASRGPPGIRELDSLFRWKEATLVRRSAAPAKSAEGPETLSIAMERVQKQADQLTIIPTKARPVDYLSTIRNSQADEKFNLRIDEIRYRMKDQDVRDRELAKTRQAVQQRKAESRARADRQRAVYDPTGRRSRQDADEVTEVMKRLEAVTKVPGPASHSQSGGRTPNAPRPVRKAEILRQRDEYTKKYVQRPQSRASVHQAPVYDEPVWPLTRTSVRMAAVKAHLGSETDFARSLSYLARTASKKQYNALKETTAKLQTRKVQELRAQRLDDADRAKYMFQTWKNAEAARLEEIERQRLDYTRPKPLPEKKVEVKRPRSRTLTLVESIPGI